LKNQSNRKIRATISFSPIFSYFLLVHFPGNQTGSDERIRRRELPCSPGRWSGWRERRPIDGNAGRSPATCSAEIRGPPMLWLGAPQPPYPEATAASKPYGSPHFSADRLCLSPPTPSLSLSLSPPLCLVVLSKLLQTGVRSLYRRLADCVSE
jgi:hypothetical protein